MKMEHRHASGKCRSGYPGEPAAAGPVPAVPIVRAEITDRALQAMLDSCRAAWPDEACGVVAGRIGSSPSRAGEQPGLTVQAVAVYPIRNIAGQGSGSAADSFAFDPADWTRALYAMPKNRQSLVGFYHSHPATAPVPSEADRSGLRYARPASCWIVSLADPRQPAVVPYAFDGAMFRRLMLAQISV